MTERTTLFAIIGVAFVGRAFVIWFSRPEFVGWFNHCYYYWIQVKGLLENNQLPFADMPLLFYLYAAEASVLHWFGMDMPKAIVTATRFTMSLAPALIACSFYLISRSRSGSRPLSRGQWVLVVLSAFLPLTFVHMPELLQKNMLGLVLLSAFMYAIRAQMQSRKRKWLIILPALFILITLTHLGTLAACLLFGLSLLVAVIGEKAGSKQAILIVLLLGAFSGAGLVSIYVLDPDAFVRIILYVQSSLPHSLLGGLFSSGPIDVKLAFFFVIAFPIALIFLLIKTYAKHRPSLQYADRIFWLANVIWLYLLVLPVIDVDLVTRFLLFIPLPALVVLAYGFEYVESRRLMRAFVGLASAVVMLMVFGETMDLMMRYPDKKETHSELLNLKRQYRLSENDLVITTYGVNPICNWFLGTKSGLITAFNQNSRTSYDRLFVLNPREAAPVTAPAGHASTLDRFLFRTQEERYRVMRQRIQLQDKIEPVVTNEYFEFYELHVLPERWLFDSAGNWIGYRIE